MHRRIWGQVVLLGSLVVSGLVGAVGLPRGAGVAEVEAAFPGRNGLIAFSSNRAFPHDMDIYTITPKGKELTRLTDNVGQNSDPAWSADGTRITFTSDRDGNAEIYAMNADGSGQTNLTRNDAPEVDHAWSPDGQQLVFTSWRSGYPRLYVMNADGTKQKLENTKTMFGGINDYPDWQPLVQGTAVTAPSHGDQGDKSTPAGHGQGHGSHGHQSHGQGGKQR